MRKISLFLLTFFFYFLAGTFSTNIAYAATCTSLSITGIGAPYAFRSDFNKDITITSNSECLDTTQNYIIVAYPQSIENSPDFSAIYMLYALDSKQPIDKKTIAAKIDLTRGSIYGVSAGGSIPGTIGSSNLGSWRLNICSGDIMSCGDLNNVKGTLNFFVYSPFPIPTPTPNPNTCSKKNTTCQTPDQCQPSGENACGVYICRETPDTRGSGYGRCQVAPTPTPTSQVAPSCSKADSLCDVHDECQPLEESGCSSYYCLSDPDNPRLSKGKCQFRAISPITTTPAPALLPCAAGCTKDGKKCFSVDQIKAKPALKAEIAKCTKIDSAIGPIETDPAAFIKTIFTVLLSMAGGWATYLIITAGYQLMFSGHEAEKVQEARDKITSAIVGLVFMILSLIILKVIGVDIFQLPTFVR